MTTPDVAEQVSVNRYNCARWVRRRAGYWWHRLLEAVIAGDHAGVDESLWRLRLLAAIDALSAAEFEGRRCQALMLARRIHDCWSRRAA